MISSIGLDLLNSLETCKLKAYQDSAGIWTIGWGTTHFEDYAPVKKNDIISQKIADNLRDNELEGIYSKIVDFVKIPLDQYEWDALLVFCYNVGVQGFKTSTLLRELNAGNEIKENYFTRWDKIHIDGKLIASKGLLERRKKEYKLFKGEIENG